MCGIQILVQALDSVDEAPAVSKTWDSLTQANSRRGPDYHGETTAMLSKVQVRLGAHVLHLRGPSTQSQPLISSNGDIFCWNGEVFSGLDIGSQNDGTILMNKIQQMKLLDPEYFVLKTMQLVEGPYAFVYLDKEQEKLWFSRDFLGRRSLLIKYLDTQTMLLSSVANNDDGGWEELPAQKVFCLDLLRCNMPFASSMVSHQWIYKNEGSTVALDTFQPTIPFAQVIVDHPSQMSMDPELLPLENGFPEIPESWKPYVDGLQNVLSQSIRQRVESIPVQDNPSFPRVGILFSGGVDCITIAALLTQMLPHTEPIELFNVSFENPRQTKTHGSASKYNVPDRLTGIQGWKELCRIDPQRQWRFVQVDVPYVQVLEHKSHIRQLLVPSDTVMDMSIGMAIWFAARGIGNLVSDNGETTPYTGLARVLLLGMGADEQLGGYSRHRSAWDRGGTDALAREIRMDVQRIATRNLGRDDRIVSDTSKEARYPFLAATVVDYLSTVPVSRKMDMRLPRGIGEKLLLRMLARRLGLTQASVLAKRAIQFGARTAKMESSNTKGQDSL